MAVRNGAATQVVVSGVKPISRAKAAATAPSKPLPLVGSPISQGSGLLSDGSKYGGYAGLSAPMVSVPGVSSARASGAQASADGLGSTDAGAVDGASVAGASVAGASVAGAWVAGAVDGDAAPPPVQAAANAVTRARAMTPRVVRIGGVLLGLGTG